MNVTLTDKGRLAAAAVRGGMDLDDVVEILAFREQELCAEIAGRLDAMAAEERGLAGHPTLPEGAKAVAAGCAIAYEHAAHIARGQS